ncbi:MAG: Unknown protein [uncultured Sulfurovum sp.]|uniref:Uncharacterized protein n=1 Tax=uncultured Sulfurovum sp. TaxID=269237 RepID=A0A6S6T9U7_9BACT|nr:MAG: Unknown protein [uncultured Sulfurovum sp.]
MFGTNLVLADHAQRHQIIDGMSIYLGTIPAQLTQNYVSMHGGVTDEEHSYHIVISIFDTKSGKRITSAKLKTTVALVGDKGNTKDLEPMHEVLLGYGNYFTMHQAAHYIISTEISRANTKAKSVAHFIFNRPKE